ncbi:hypothetical protein J6590_035274 [Homalodisca vitripennis]|nr:hypothetical protein J6590_035274 [Homalodisca vitripennis]
MIGLRIYLALHVFGKESGRNRAAQIYWSSTVFTNDDNNKWSQRKKEWELGDFSIAPPWESTGDGHIVAKRFPSHSLLRHCYDYCRRSSATFTDSVTRLLIVVTSQRHAARCADDTDPAVAFVGLDSRCHHSIIGS